MVCTPLFTIAQASSCPAECNDLRAASATALARAELDIEAAESATDYSRFCLQNCVHDASSKESACTPAGDAPTSQTPLIAPSSFAESSLLNERAGQMGKPDAERQLSMFSVVKQLRRGLQSNSKMAVSEVRAHTQACWHTVSSGSGRTRLTSLALSPKHKSRHDKSERRANGIPLWSLHNYTMTTPKTLL